MKFSGHDTYAERIQAVKVQNGWIISCGDKQYIAEDMDKVLEFVQKYTGGVVNLSHMEIICHSAVLESV